MVSFRQLGPTEIVFGAGSVRQLAPIARRFGSRALVITGKHAMRSSGVLDVVARDLAAAGLTVDLATVAPDPTAADVDAAVRTVHRAAVDVIVGLGGGSAMDAAKAASVGAALGPVGPLVGTTVTAARTLPVIAAPTTAGTGAEVTRGAIVTDRDRGLKSGIRGDCVFPAVAVVDPELLGTAPRRVLHEAAFDAFCHAVETTVARGANPLSLALSNRAHDHLARALPRLAAGDRRPQVLESLSFAALLGGMVVAAASTCLPHRLQQAVGSLAPRHVAHGRGLAIVYPAWVRRCEPSASAPFRAIAAHYGRSTLGEVVGDLEEALDLIADLRACGLKPTDVSTVAQHVTGNLDNDPTEGPYHDTIVAILEESFDAGC